MSQGRYGFPASDVIGFPVSEWGRSSGRDSISLIALDLVFSFAWEDYGRKSAWLLITASPVFVPPVVIFFTFGRYL